MNVETIIQLVSSVGFPIVCCGVMFYNNSTTQKELTNAINKMSEELIKILEHIKQD